MRYYIMKEKRGSLDMSETEGAIISLGMIVFIVKFISSGARNSR